MSRHGPVPFHAVWDNNATKVVVKVLRCEGLVAMNKDGTSDIHCKILINGKTVDKTPIMRKTLKPVFNSFFLFLHVAIQQQLSIQVHHGSKILGTVSYGAIESWGPPDLVFHKSTPLSAKIADQKKSYLAPQGCIVVAMSYSLAPESPYGGHRSGPTPYFNPATNAEVPSMYYHHASDIKPGDLLLTSDYGIIGSMVKCTTNSLFTSVAMVVPVPNKWTGKLILCVLVCGRNLGKLEDIYGNRTRESTVFLFRLDEFVYHYYGVGLWWAPLQTPLRPDQDRILSEQALLAHKRGQVAQVVSVDKHVYAFPFAQAMADFKRKELRGLIGGHSLPDLFSASLVSQLLTQVGLRFSAAFFPCDLLAGDLFRPPTILRCPKRFTTAHPLFKMQSNFATMRRPPRKLAPEPEIDTFSPASMRASQDPPRPVVSTYQTFESPPTSSGSSQQERAPIYSGVPTSVISSKGGLSSTIDEAEDSDSDEELDIDVAIAEYMGVPLPGHSRRENVPY